MAAPKSMILSVEAVIPEQLEDLMDMDIRKQHLHEKDTRDLDNNLCA